MTRRPIVLGPARAGYGLGQAAPSEEDKSALQIESAVRDIATELHLRVERLSGELGLAWNSELRQGIALIGKDFSAAEVMEQISMVARGLEDIAGSILSGPLQAYATSEVQSILSEDVNSLRTIASSAEGHAQPIAEGHEGLAEEHLLSYVEDLKELRDAAERLMVSSEKAPPVYEAGEKERTEAEGILWVIGALAASGTLLYIFLGE